MFMWHLSPDCPSGMDRTWEVSFQLYHPLLLEKCAIRTENIWVSKFLYSAKLQTPDNNTPLFDLYLLKLLNCNNFLSSFC